MIFLFQGLKISGSMLVLRGVFNCSPNRPTHLVSHHLFKAEDAKSQADCWGLNDMMLPGREMIGGQKCPSKKTKNGTWTMQKNPTFFCWNIYINGAWCVCALCPRVLLKCLSVCTVGMVLFCRKFATSSGSFNEPTYISSTKKIPFIWQAWMHLKWVFGSNFVWYPMYSAPSLEIATWIQESQPWDGSMVQRVGNHL